MRLRKASLWASFVIALIALFAVATQSRLNGLEMGGDFVQYWSAGRLNLQGKSPYNVEQLAELQRPHEPAGGQALIMWLPPWAYALVMPVGMLPYTIARVAWLLLEVAIVFACTNWLWAHYRGAKGWVWLAWIVSFLHWATLEALRGGQVSPFVFAGAVCFLAAIQRKQPWLAGMSLAPVLLKPHLLYLFSLAALLWSFKERQWRVLSGCGVSLLAGTALACLPNRHLLAQYIESARQQPPDQWITATIGGQLRLHFGAEHFWLQFVSVVVGLAWLAWYWRRHHHTWNWWKRTPPLAMVSLGTAAYGWRHDQIVTLLAILPLLAWVVTAKWPALCKGIFLGLYLSINWIAIASTQPQDWFWWLPWAVLAWYLVAQRLQRKFSTPGAAETIP
ncbi:MAG: glycosyltransferase family 87 protein [Chloroflexota bacterium]